MNSPSHILSLPTAEIEGCQEDDVVTPKKGDKKPKSASPSSGEEINSMWITEHARQVGF